VLLRFRFLVPKEAGGIVSISFQCTCNLLVFSFFVGTRFPFVLAEVNIETVG
jgi:hypothetical protein